MGRGVEAHPVAGRVQDGQQGRPDRALAVGAADMDAGVLLLRPIQFRQQRVHGLQAELDLEELQPVEIRPGLLIGHGAHRLFSR